MLALYGHFSRLMTVLQRALISGKTRRLASVDCVCVCEPDAGSGAKGCGLPSIALLAS